MQNHFGSTIGEQPLFYKENGPCIALYSWVFREVHRNLKNRLEKLLQNRDELPELINMIKGDGAAA